MIHLQLKNVSNRKSNRRFGRPVEGCATTAVWAQPLSAACKAPVGPETLGTETLGTMQTKTSQVRPPQTRTGICLASKEVCSFSDRHLLRLPQASSDYQKYRAKIRQVHRQQSRTDSASDASTDSFDSHASPSDSDWSAASMSGANDRNWNPGVTELAVESRSQTFSVSARTCHSVQARRALTFGMLALRRRTPTPTTTIASLRARTHSCAVQAPRKT